MFPDLVSDRRFEKERVRDAPAVNALAAGSIHITNFDANSACDAAPSRAGKQMSTCSGNRIMGMSVFCPMQKVETPLWFILIGGMFFILALAVSAIWEADIRWLHFFQAWMYLATIALSWRRSRWGYFVGFSAAGLWDYTNIFATTFFWNGLQQVSRWIHTGQMHRPDLMIAVPAWLSNLLVVIGCVWGYYRLPRKSWEDAGKLLLTFALTTGFFALDMYLFQPRYLGIFPRLLHPHLP